MNMSGRNQYPTIFVPAPPQSVPVMTESYYNIPQPDNTPVYTQNDSGTFSLFNPGSQHAPDTDSFGIKSVINVRVQSVSSWLSNRYRSWLEFFNTKKFGLPKLDGVIPRIQHNLTTFTGNYLCLSGVLLVYCIFTSFILLLALIALAGLMYSIRQKTLKGPVVIGGSEVPPVLLYTFALIAFIPLFYLAGASSIIGWILGSSAFLVILHSTLYKSEDESGSMLESP